MKKLHALLFILMVTTTAIAANLAASFKEAAALADAQDDKDRATRIYGAIDLNDYYQKKYNPVFQSCLKSTKHADMSTF